MREQNTKEEIYTWISKTIRDNKYFKGSKKDKGILKSFVISQTGYTESHVDTLIKKLKSKGTLKPQSRKVFSFERIYTKADIGILAHLCSLTENAHGASILKICYDMYIIHYDEKYERLHKLSLPHFYTLKRSYYFKEKCMKYIHTKQAPHSIGIRTKPRNGGKPGYLRVDTVHQGDTTAGDGVYHINFVDEVTQWEYVACVPYISELYINQVIEKLYEVFPFRIINFHSDNGREFINESVASLLLQLCITQTKSRARRSTDNGLIESKNKVIIRKHIPRGFIDKKYSPLVNDFYQNNMNTFLNFHRHCMFPETVIIDGKKKKIYKEIKTPYQKLIAVPGYEKYLHKENTAQLLKEKANNMTHIACLEKLDKAKSALFKVVFRK